MYKNLGKDVLTVWKFLISTFPFSNWPRQKKAIAILWSPLGLIVNVFLICILGLPNIVKLSLVDLVFIPIWFKPISILLILSDSLCRSSLIPLNFDIPFTMEAAMNKKIKN